MSAALSVWTAAQRTSKAQRAGRYLPASGAHPGKMLPAVARQAIAAWTRPGEWVADPMCGVGTTLVEAAHLGRAAIGIEYETRWAALARANLAHARARGATGQGEVVCGDARRLRALLPEGLGGQVALVLSSPPYGPSLHGQTQARPGRGVRKWDATYSSDPANLAHVGTAALVAALEEILGACRWLLRPGGTLALTVRPWREGGELVDLPGAVARAGERAGLEAVERDVVLLAAARDGGLVPRASFFQLDHVRKARRRGIPQQVIAHEDLLVFRRPR